MTSTQPRHDGLRAASMTAAAVLLLGWGPAAHALLTDGSFENASLTSIADVLGSAFPDFSGQWGHESSTITGTVGTLSPHAGTSMLSMTPTIGTLTQTLQAVDVSAYAGVINGGANFSFSAWFNAADAGAIGGVGMQFFSGGTYGTQIGSFVTGNITVDGDPTGWQQRSIGGLIPAGTAWMLAQVYYSNASLVNAVGGSQAGYVDSAAMSITAVPETPTYGMLSVGLALLGAMARRRRAADQ